MSIPGYEYANWNWTFHYILSQKVYCNKIKEKCPAEVLKEFSENKNFVSLAKNTGFIDYPNAQIILIGARDGKDAIKKDLGINIEEKKEDSNIFNRLKMRKITFQQDH